MRGQNNRLRLPVLSDSQIIFTLTDIPTNCTGKIEESSKSLKHSLHRSDFFSLNLNSCNENMMSYETIDSMIGLQKENDRLVFLPVSQKEAEKHGLPIN